MRSVKTDPTGNVHKLLQVLSVGCILLHIHPQGIACYIWASNSILGTMTQCQVSRAVPF